MSLPRPRKLGASGSDTPVEIARSAHFPGTGGSNCVPVAVLETADPVAAFGGLAAAAGKLALPTSGTSGVARTVVRTARSWVDSFDPVTELIGLSADSRVWLPGPLGATMNLFAAVHADAVGARLVPALEEATHVQLTPSRLQALLDDGSDLSERMVVVAGDALDPSLRVRAQRTGAQIAHYYGAAELSFVAWGLDRDDLRPFPGVDLQISDGEIWVRSRYVAEGYLAGASGPLRRAPDGSATVGDRGRLQGGRLLVDGRPDAILTAGVTVLVADVEAALRRAVRGRVVVVGLAHPRLGRLVAAVLTDEADGADARAVTADLGAARPRRWFVRSELPTTPAGKIDRQGLAAELERELASDS